MRDLTASMSTALQAPTVRPVLIGRLDIANDPVQAWTGPGLFAPTGTGDAALDGFTFDPAEGFVDMSSIKEDQSIGGPVTITAKGHDLNEDLLRQIVRDRRAWRGQKAWLWMGLLDETSNVVSNPVRIKTGVMTKMEVKRSRDDAAILVTVDQDLGNAESGPFRVTDHVRIWPADTFSTFVVRLSNKPSGIERTDFGTPNPGFRPRPGSPRDFFNRGR